MLARKRCRWVKRVMYSHSIDPALRVCMNASDEELELVRKVVGIYDQKYVAQYLNGISHGDWCRETINRWLNGKASPKLSHAEYVALEKLVPSAASKSEHTFDFIDLFAGIGGLRRG